MSPIDHDGGENEVDTLGGRHRDPQQIGTCRIEARIATTPWSFVYRAVDTELQRTVVVKLLAAPHDEDPATVQRFQTASQALLGVVTPHIVQVLRTGLFEDKAPYAVYEFLDGEDLERAVRRERQLVPAAAVRAILDTAQALSSALERGVVHGDIRPRHMIRARGSTKVIGFGQSPPRTTAQKRLLWGHPAYIAPEVSQGQGADQRSDIYSLGVSLFELLTGRSPYGGGGADALVACHVHEPFPTLRSSDDHMPEELDELLARMVSKKPADRFQTHVELLQAGAVVLPALRRIRPDDPSVIVEDGRQTGLRVQLPEGDLLLGRVPGEGLEIDDGRVSRRHAMLRRAGDYIEVEDLGSRNGIRVNGVEVRSRQVFPGDRIEIGDTILRIDGAVAPVTQMPALGMIPASPVRGAFGDVEVSHSPALQATPDALSDTNSPGAPIRLRLLAKIAPLLALRNERDIHADLLKVLGDVLEADDRVYVRIQRGQPVFEAKSSHDAQVLSCVLPALERALPGQLSLATSVRVGTDDRWSVLLAPVLHGGKTSAYIVLVRTTASFPETSLSALEASCALMSMRASSPG